MELEERKNLSKVRYDHALECLDAAKSLLDSGNYKSAMKIGEKAGHEPDFSHFNRASVRLWRARSPMQIPPRSTPRVDRKRVKKAFLTR